MNAAASSPMQRQPHPSPHRERVRPLALWFGIAASPLAWSLQLLVNAGLSARGCFPHDVPLAQPLWLPLTAVLAAIEAAALVLCVLGGLVAWRNWRRTHGERPGSAHHVLEAGDGRTRFMALIGLLCSGLFGLAVVFAAFVPALVPGCGG
jgi:hypothetical protein